MLSALLPAYALCIAPSCASFVRDVTDIELPWKVLASSGDMRLVEFVVRPSFAVDTIYLAGGFNDWTLPGGQGTGRVYEMEYDSKRDYWVCRVWMRTGAWEYIYYDGILYFADDKNAVARSDGNKISRMVVR